MTGETAENGGFDENSLLGESDSGDCPKAGQSFHKVETPIHVWMEMKKQNELI